MEWEYETRLALYAAIEGARIAIQSGTAPEIQAKESSRDIVTTVDIKVDKCINTILSESAYPILSEEAVARPVPDIESGQLYWVIDPIDGTANFVNGLEYFGVAIGLCRGMDFLVGAVCIPRIDQLYCTLDSSRALLNGRHLIHKHSGVSDALIAASFSGYFSNAHERAKEYTLFGKINNQTRGCLRLGSAAANICFTAAGRLQAAYGLNARLWDVAGAIAIAKGAGCAVLLAPSPYGPFRVDYIVGSRDVVTAIHFYATQIGLMENVCQIQ
jgi:myo-inositol-1(or 4)-monophosphatase